MFVKVIGAIIVLTGCMLYGVYKGMLRRQRIKDLITFKNTLQLLAGEINYGYSTLMECFRNISRQFEGEIKLFYEYMYKKILEGEYVNLSNLWEEACRYKLINSCMDGEDIELISLVKGLPVQMDNDMQIAFLEEKIMRIEEVIEDAKTKIETQCRIYRVISATVGVLVVIILI